MAESAIMPYPHIRFPDMSSDFAEWVRGLREHIGAQLGRPRGITKTELARLLGVGQPAITKWEQGRTAPEDAQKWKLLALASQYGYSSTDIGIALPGPMSATVQIVGYVGGGGEVFSVDAYAQGDGMDVTDAPVNWSGAPLVAVRVRGSSMHPIRDGWTIFYTRDYSGVPDHCIGQLCVVQVADDGPKLVKELFRGSGPGLFSLRSWNAPPIEDVQLEWAAKVIDIRPA